MTELRPISLLLGALGGQGGGVLTNWLVEAARLAGYPAQATSIPGVAQRTGATTYYFEIFPVHNPPADPVFCLFPSAGDVDIVAALEPTEAGRAMEGGFITSRTTVITSTQRVYSTAEKSVAGDGGMEAAPILETLARVAKTLVQINPAANSGQNSQTNALLFGAIIASGALPFTEDEARRAIESQGLAVASNLAGFKTGLAAVRQQNGGFPPETETVYDAAPAGFEEALAALPEPLRPVVGHALARLVDYQDANYARQFLARLTPILEADQADGGPARSYRLTEEVARRLAAWMCHEDIVRVAQLKTRPGRLGRIRQEVGAREGEPVEIVDFLSPGREEASGLLPAPLFRLLLNGKDKDGKESGGLHLSWPTSSPWGYAALKFLASLRALRPHTLAYAQEQSAIETWLVAVREAAGVDYALACQVAELAAWARGYGDVRARGIACLENIFENWGKKLHENPEAVKVQVQASLHTARNDPDNACKKGE